MDLLNKLKEILDKPVKLSDTEKEKIKQVFLLVQDWIAESEKEILELDAEEAYRRIGVLNVSLSGAQQQWLNPNLDVYVRDNANTIEPFSNDGKFNEGAPIRHIGPDGSAITILESDDPTRFPVADLSQKPTTEQFQTWLNQLEPKAKAIADRLDCVKDFPELGGEVICKDCSRDALVACIRMEDPSYTDASTAFIQEQLR